MTVEKTCVVRCEDCKKPASKWDQVGDTPGEARANVRSFGWKLIMPDVKPPWGLEATKIDICPECWAKRKKK